MEITITVNTTLPDDKAVGVDVSQLRMAGFDEDVLEAYHEELALATYNCLVLGKKIGLKVKEKPSKPKAKKPKA